MHINQISQYFRVYLPFNLIMMTKSSTLFTNWTSAILTAILKAWTLSITSLRSLAEAPYFNNRELTNRRLLHDDAVGFRDISTAHAHLGTCRRRDKVDDVGESDLPASWKQQDVRLFFKVFSLYFRCFCQIFQVSP